MERSHCVTSRSRGERIAQAAIQRWEEALDGSLTPQEAHLADVLASELDEHAISSVRRSDYLKRAGVIGAGVLVAGVFVAVTGVGEKAQAVGLAGGFAVGYFYSFAVKPQLLRDHVSALLTRTQAGAELVYYANEVFKGLHRATYMG